MTQEIMVVALVHDEERDLWVESTEEANLLVLLRDESLFEDGQLDEEALFGQEEIRAEAARGYAPVVPGQREFEWFVDPLVPVQGEQLREELLTGVGE